MTQNRKLEPADVHAIYAAGLSGYWPEPLLTPDELIALSELCLAGGRCVRTIEAYKVTAEYQQLDLELSLFGWTDEPTAEEWPQRIREHHELVLAIALQARRRTEDVQFQVWLDWLDDEVIETPAVAGGGS